jgi:hypothetical protein
MPINVTDTGPLVHQAATSRPPVVATVVPPNPFQSVIRPISQNFSRNSNTHETSEQGRQASIARANSRLTDPLGLPNSGNRKNANKKGKGPKSKKSSRETVRHESSDGEDEKDTVTLTVLLFPLQVRFTCLCIRTSWVLIMVFRWTKSQKRSTPVWRGFNSPSSLVVSFTPSSSAARMQGSCLRSNSPSSQSATTLKTGVR